MNAGAFTISPGSVDAGSAAVEVGGAVVAGSAAVVDSGFEPEEPSFVASANTMARRMIPGTKTTVKPLAMFFMGALFPIP